MDAKVVYRYLPRKTLLGSFPLVLPPTRMSRMPFFFVRLGTALCSLPTIQEAIHAPKYPDRTRAALATLNDEVTMSMAVDRMEDGFMEPPLFSWRMLLGIVWLGGLRVSTSLPVLLPGVPFDLLGDDDDDDDDDPPRNEVIFDRILLLRR